jgi:hypothetical protein
LSIQARPQSKQAGDDPVTDDMGAVFPIIALVVGRVAELDHEQVVEPAPRDERPADRRVDLAGRAVASIEDHGHHVEDHQRQHDHLKRRKPYVSERPEGAREPRAERASRRVSDDAEQARRDESGPATSR